MASPYPVEAASGYAVGTAGAALTVTVAAPPAGRSRFIDGFEANVGTAAVTNALTVDLIEGSNTLTRKAFPAAAAIGEQRGTLFPTPLGPFNSVVTLVMGAPAGSTVMNGSIYYHDRQ